MSELKPCEAIEILESIYPSKKQIVTGEYPDVAEALDMAIDALRRAQPANEPLMLNEPWEMLERLEAECREVGDGDYTNEYMWGHRNGQIELLRQILNTGEGTCESDRRKPEGSENDG